MAFSHVVEPQLSAHHGVGERVDIQLACHLHGVAVCNCFGDLDKSHEAVVCQPLLESGGDDDRHLFGGVGRRGWKLGARGRERALYKKRAAMESRDITKMQAPIILVRICTLRQGDMNFV